MRSSVTSLLKPALSSFIQLPARCYWLVPLPSSYTWPEQTTVKTVATHLCISFFTFLPPSTEGSHTLPLNFSVTGATSYFSLSLCAQQLAKMEWIFTEERNKGLDSWDEKMEKTAEQTFSCWWASPLIPTTLPASTATSTHTGSKQWGLQNSASRKGKKIKV